MKPHLIRSLWSRPAWPASRIVSYEIVNSSKTVRNCYHVRQFHHSPRSGIVKPYLLADIGEGTKSFESKASNLDADSMQVSQNIRL